MEKRGRPGEAEKYWKMYLERRRDGRISNPRPKDIDPYLAVVKVKEEDNTDEAKSRLKTLQRI